MARYIDADALRAEFKEDERGLYHYTGIWAAIDAEPTIDAVPVVRCKDCKHSCFVKSCSKYECTKGCGALKYSTDFCSYGERKDGATDTNDGHKKE